MIRQVATSSSESPSTTVQRKYRSLWRSRIFLGDGQLLLVTKIDILLTPLETHGQTIFYDPPYSRGNINLRTINYLERQQNKWEKRSTTAHGDIYRCLREKLEKHQINQDASLLVVFFESLFRIIRLINDVYGSKSYIRSQDG